MIDTFHQLNVNLKGLYFIPNPISFTLVGTAIFMMGYFHHNLLGIFRDLSAVYALPRALLIVFGMLLFLRLSS